MWDDSIVMSDEGIMKYKCKLHLPRPKKNVVSPLNKYEDTRFNKRRRVKRWSSLESDTLRASVKKYGVGNWKLILNNKHDIFGYQTQIPSFVIFFKDSLLKLYSTNKIVI